MLPTSVKKGGHLKKNVNRSANILKSVFLNIKMMSNKSSFMSCVEWLFKVTDIPINKEVGKSMEL